MDGCATRPRGDTALSAPVPRTPGSTARIMGLQKRLETKEFWAVSFAKNERSSPIYANCVIGRDVTLDGSTT